VQLRQYIRASPKQKRRLTARPDEGAAGGRGKTGEQKMWLGGCKGPFFVASLFGIFVEYQPPHMWRKNVVWVDLSFVELRFG